MDFYDRNEELATCRRLMESDKQELMVIYGRRRVGKTALISECVRGSNGIYFMGVKASSSEQLFRFSKKVSDFLGLKG